VAKRKTKGLVQKHITLEVRVMDPDHVDTAIARLQAVSRSIMLLSPENIQIALFMHDFYVGREDIPLPKTMKK
jgi:hypothetical protein